MGSAKSDPSAAWFDKFLGQWTSPYGANGQITDVAQLHMMKTIRLKSSVGIWPDKFPPKHS